MSAKGTPTFIMQRASAVVLAPLALWFLFSVALHLGDTYAEARAWLAQPLNGILLSALVTVGAFHMRIGLGEVIDDYIHGSMRGPMRALNAIAALGVIVAVFWSLYGINS